MRNPIQEEINSIRALKASARKSFNEYKPLLKYPNGRTEVLARAVIVDELMNFRQTFSRGKIFNTKEEAAAYAEATKQVRIDDCFRRANKHGFEVV